VESEDSPSADSGEIEVLPDGSVSVPILEEELLVTKRVVVGERVIVKKSATRSSQPVEAELRKESVALDGDSPVSSWASSSRLAAGSWRAGMTKEFITAWAIAAKMRCSKRSNPANNSVAMIPAREAFSA
jgi:hypothetical protein